MAHRKIGGTTRGTVIHPAGRLQARGAIAIGSFHPTEHARFGLQFELAVSLVLKFEVRQTRRQFVRTIQRHRYRPIQRMT